MRVRGVRWCCCLGAFTTSLFLSCYLSQGPFGPQRERPVYVFPLPGSTPAFCTWFPFVTTVLDSRLVISDTPLSPISKYWRGNYYWGEFCFAGEPPGRARVPVHAAAALAPGMGAAGGIVDERRVSGGRRRSCPLVCDSTRVPGVALSVGSSPTA